MNKLLKSLIAFMFVIALPVQVIKAQTTAEIIKHKIYRVDRFNFSSTWSAYYDSKGNVTKEIDVFGLRKEKYVTLYRYKDTLLVQTIDSVFEANKFIEPVISDYVYEYDAQKRVRSKTIITKGIQNRLEKQVYRYDDQNRIDTTFFYDDNPIVPHPESVQKPVPDRVFALKKVKIFTYTDTGWIFIKECPFPDEFFPCTIQQNFTSDALDVEIIKSGISQAGHVTKKYKKNGYVYRVEGNDVNRQIYQYKRNRLGLVSEIVEDTWRKGDNPITSVTRVKYYCRK